ncbi:FAS1 domain-containing protein [Cryphonectria parasitica EP155]|uniref:FAS1 domain-containing protein n=1 Tax=Cryphonectria parasitica (strain ATCC 38755 / EP155) TaxID=660469 RepID=A0A9P5CVU5_CRYP1|nr:FAS1 domain-containing protein [Cryphonectria parasitica EP155]KAF3771306.1 FAS1 domain-containing protein [Cryphonectria parasitica EP155]
MKTATLLPFAALASGFVVPDAQVFAQLPVHEEQSHDDVSWLDWLSSADAVTSSIHDVVDTWSTGVEDAVNDIKGRLETEFESLFDEEEEYSLDAMMDRPHHGGHRHKHKPNETIYQLISKSKYTTKFKALVDDYEDIVEILNSTSANYTLFVPIDKAFEHIPEDHKPSKDFVEAVLKYHIGLGLYPAGRVLVTHTLPTALEEPLLGDKPQRLRTSVGILSGIRVNFYSKVVGLNLPATNGVIHAVKSILVPPPNVGRALTLFPSRFSTLLLAFEKTNFTSYIHGIKLTGSTVFAPDNGAFAKLGPAANAFLFNTHKGLGYLKALLKYHVVPNEIVYSDAYYSSSDSGGDDDDDDSDEEAGARQDVGRGHTHLDVPTLLGDKNIAIDVARLGGFIRVKVNGYIPIATQDVIAKNGAIHLPARVLIPPHKHGRHHAEEMDEEISVEELMERLADYVDDESANGENQNKAAVELEL